MSPTTNGSHLHDLRSYSRNWLGEFIDLYQSEQCLWHPKHQDYSNHSIRNKAYDRLVEKLKEVEPSPDRAMVVRKINSLRSAFRREYRKLCSKSNYETRLWYYDKLLFIADQKPYRQGSSPADVKPPKRALQLGFDEDESMEFDTDDNNLDAAASQTEGHTQEQVSKNYSITSDCVTFAKTENQSEQQQQQIQHTHSIATQPQPPHSTEVKVLEITSLDSNSQRQIQQAVNSLEQQHQIQQQLQQQQQTGQSTTQLAQIHQQVPTIQIARDHLQSYFGNSYSTTAVTHRQDDEFDAIGMNVASKLRVMNTHQRIIAEKLISDVLFNGQLDSLTVNSTLTQ